MELIIAALIICFTVWILVRRKDRNVYIERATSQVGDVLDAPDFDDEGPPEQVNRRVARHRGSFRAYLVRAARAKFGPLRPTESNRLVVRKFLYDLCVDKHVRVRHIEANVDFATSMVLVPSDTQLEALAVHRTEYSALQNQGLRDLGGAFAPK